MSPIVAIVANLFAVSIAAVLASRLPAVFVFVYVVVYSRFFGFLDLAVLSAEAAFNPLVILYLGAIGATAMRLGQGRRFDGLASFVLAVYGALFVYGVLRPFLVGESAIADAFIDGKEMLAIGFMPYLLLHDSTELRRAVVGAVKIAGFILTAEVLAALWLGLAPPAAEPIEEALGVRHGIHVYSSMFIYFALVLHLYVDRIGRRAAGVRHVLLALYYVLGLAMQGHRSLIFGFLMTAIAIEILETRVRTGLRLLLAACVVGLFFLSGVRSVEFEERVVTPVQEFLHEEGAISSRQQLNAFRYDAMAVRPLLGYGFIHEKSALGRRHADNTINLHTKRYGTVDAGYVDMQIRFGLFGSGLLLVGWGVFLLRAFRGRPVDEAPRREVVALIAFLSSYLLVSFTWSVLTYEFGLFVASAAMYLILRARSADRIGWRLAAPCPDGGIAP